MTLLELVTFLRRNILDDTGGQGVDWVEYYEDNPDSIQLRWNNEELVANINEAINVVYRRIEPIKDMIHICIQPEVTEYTLPEYVLKPLQARLRSNGRQILEGNLDDIFKSLSPSTCRGTTTKYIPDGKTGKIIINPIPVLADGLDMYVYRLPKTKLRWEDSDLSPEIKDAYQIPMLSYAAHLCYMKDEANTYDPGRAAQYLSIFNKEFPEVSVYANTRKSRTNNRPIKYGGGFF